jgi:hypothetical protein
MVQEDKEEKTVVERVAELDPSLKQIIKEIKKMNQERNPWNSFSLLPWPPSDINPHSTTGNSCYQRINLSRPR